MYKESFNNKILPPQISMIIGIGDAAIDGSGDYKEGGKPTTAQGTDERLIGVRTPLGQWIVGPKTKGEVERPIDQDPSL